MFAITAPRACMTRAILWGESSAASVVTVSASVKGEASFGLATFAGMAFGVTVIVCCCRRWATVAGRVVASPESTYGEFVPRPSESPVMLKSWLPVFATVNVRARPVAPQFTRPFGSLASVPKARVVAETLTLACVPVPMSWSAEGSAVQRLSEVVMDTVAGYATALVGRNITFSALDRRRRPGRGSRSSPELERVRARPGAAQRDRDRGRW